MLSFLVWKETMNQLQQYFDKKLQTHLQFANSELNLQEPLIMGILNVTPDSFSDGGQFIDFDSAIKQAKQMLVDGADIIDIGGESTRPGAADVSEDEELHRVVPLIEALSKELDVPISIDTSKAVVMYEAVHAGASMINDVYALQKENALQIAAQLNVPVCLMHMQGKPETMQKKIEYKNVIQEVVDFFQQRINSCIESGINKENIIIDPGFGFGKNLQHNIDLLNNLQVFVESGFPVLAGLSRKSMLGQITGKDVSQRLAASLAVAQLAVNKGTQILRVHDVAETKDILRVLQAVKAAEMNLNSV